ncbi:hypothetical protein ACIPW5_39105 [Streptomyces sp. NPDC090077]|uniref:hypothetical protein n=1 Tax=Streptomyces sp. NPDC090077 TaxID=3365938 RepID=UPI003810CADD
MKDMWPWPPLPDLVKARLAAMAAEDDEENDDEGGERPAPGVDPHTGEALDRVVRPWDLTMLDEEMRPAVMGWLDDVVMWLNHSYGWQDSQVIPGCWPRHLGLAHDLAALAFGRLDAYEPSTAAYVGRWHSDLEDFHRRMAVALGESGRDCQIGKHKVPSEYTVTAVQQEIARRKNADRVS